MSVIRSQDPENEVGTRVSVEIDWDALEPSVEFAAGNGEQGPEEESGDRVQRAWERGALYGVRFALEVANSMPCRVSVTEIIADVQRTNATTIAAATAEAVWAAIEFVPGDELRARMEREVGRSWRLPATYLNRFER